MTNPNHNQPPWRAKAIVRLRQYLGTLPDYASTRSRLDQTWEEATSTIGGDPKLLMILEGIATKPQRVIPRDSQLGYVMQLIADIVLQEILVREIGTANRIADPEDPMEPDDDSDIPF